MKILIELLHPAHLFFFRDAIATWRARGADVKLLTRDKECLLELHRELDLPAECLSKKETSLAAEWMVRVHRLLNVMKAYEPDLCVGVMGATLAPAAKLRKIPSLIFYDTEVAKLSNECVFRISDRVVVPEAFSVEHLRKRKNVRIYPGFKEMAYIHRQRHPELFAAQNAQGVLAGKRKVVFRGISPTSIHDRRSEYWDSDKRKSLLRSLARDFELTISSEECAQFTQAPENYSGRVSEFHSLLSRIDGVFTESATVAMEAALLGKAVIYLSRSPRGYLTAMAEKSGFIQFGADWDIEKCIAVMKQKLQRDEIARRILKRDELQSTLRDPYEEILLHSAELIRLNHSRSQKRQRR